MAVGAIEPHFYRRVLEALGVPESHPGIEAAVRDKTTTELEHLAVQWDIPINAVR